jgi:hypothetical protein
MSFATMANEVTEMSIEEWIFWQHLARRLPLRLPRLRSIAYPNRNPWRPIYDIDATRTQHVTVP